jgi:hypothetical protein
MLGDPAPERKRFSRQQRGHRWTQMTRRVTPLVPTVRCKPTREGSRPDPGLPADCADSADDTHCQTRAAETECPRDLSMGLAPLRQSAVENPSESSPESSLGSSLESSPESSFESLFKSLLESSFQSIAQSSTKSSLQSSSQSSAQSSRKSSLQSSFRSSAQSSRQSTVQSSVQTSFNASFESNPGGSPSSMGWAGELWFRLCPTTTYRFDIPVAMVSFGRLSPQPSCLPLPYPELASGLRRSLRHSVPRSAADSTRGSRPDSTRG